MSLFSNMKPATGGGSGLFANTNATAQSQQQPAASGNTGTQPSTSGGGGIKLIIPHLFQTFSSRPFCQYKYFSSWEYNSSFFWYKNFSFKEFFLI